MRLVIAYDVVDDRRRARLAKLLRPYAVRTQKSTYEAELGPREVEQVRELVQRTIDATEDRVYIYRLSEVSPPGAAVVRFGAQPVDEPGPPPGFFLA